MKTETEPDDKRLFHLFRSVGMDGDGAFTAVQEIRTMAGQNILAKIDEQTAKLQAQSAELRAQGAEQSKTLQTQVASQTADLKELKADVRNMYRTIGLFIVGFGLFLSVAQFVISKLID